MTGIDHLLVNNNDEILVNLPYGKFSKQEKRVSIKAQKSVSCILYALRRISFFNNPDVRTTELYQAFRRIKHEMINFKGNYDVSLNTIKELCARLYTNSERVLSKDILYTDEQKTQKNIQVSLLYEALIKQRFFSLLNLQESGWHPKNGFSGLKNSLKNHGAHVFIGKFGSWCYTRQNSIIEFARINSHHRAVYAFKKGSYIGDYTSWTHAIVVDQVKNVDGTDMVFFRDPYDSSDGHAAERIYGLSYQNFVSRLTNHQSMHYARHQCQNENSFGIVSTNPARLTRT